MKIVFLWLLLYIIIRWPSLLGHICSEMGKLFALMRANEDTFPAASAVCTLDNYSKAEKLQLCIHVTVSDKHPTLSSKGQLFQGANAVVCRVAYSTEGVGHQLR